MDAYEELVKHHGVFMDTGCLFVSTMNNLLLTGYVNCEVLYPHYEVVWELVAQMIAPFLGEVECFVCPATGDIVLAQYATIIANQQGFATMAAWADKHDDDSYRIERNGYVDAVAGKRTLVLNDRISQGGTTRKIIAEVRRCGGEVIGVSTLAGVSTLTATALGIPKLHALCNVDVQSFLPNALPPELVKRPIVTDEALGHGAHFAVEYPDYPTGFTTLLS